MKCKVSGSSSGVGRSRPSLGSNAGPVSRLHREDVALNTRNNKGDKSEGNILRRSSRRATIERRVWSLPKKMAKSPLPTIKERTMQPKSSRKDRERKVQSTVQSKPTSKSKVSPDAKRGLVMTEETGNARRKIKKKEGMQNVGDVSDSATELEEMVETSSVSDEDDGTAVDGIVSLQERTMDAKESRENCISGGNSDSGDSENLESSENIMRTGLPLLAEAVVSLKDVPSRTLSRDFTRSDIGLEETLDTGEICLTKAVIEEVVPEYENESSSVSSSVGVVCEVNSRNAESTGQMFRNLEDVLGHSYSKLEQECDVQDKAVTEPSPPVKVSFDIIQTRANCDSEEAGIKNEVLEMEAECGESEGTGDLIAHSEGEGEGEDSSREGDQNATDSCEAQLDIRLENESKNVEVTGDESQVESDEESAGSPRDDKDNTTDLETTDHAESESSITPDCLTVKSDSLTIEHTDSEDSKADVTEVVEEVQEEEEDHVSLSVALAQLLDSGCDEAEGTETLTIHSVSSGVQTEQEERRQVMALEVNSRGVVAEKTEDEIDDEDEDEEGELVIKEEEDEESNSESEEEDELRKQVQDGQKEDDPQDCLSMMNSTRLPEQCKETRCDSDADQHDPSPSPTPAKLRKQIPPLIKICSRPPAIKTPLKCPECPMQFCTVRSLLWHFGTHGARSRENCLPPILLQDLIVPWDKPTVSLFISQATEGEKNTEKIIASTEMSLAMSPSPDAALKMDTASKQDLIMTTQILRADDSMGTNGDIILKVPIPRLKPKSQALPTFKKEKFVSILPKIISSESLSSVTPGPPHLIKMKASGSPTPQITIHAQNKQPAEVVTITPQQSVPKITIRADNSSQQVHVKPLAPVSAHSAVQIKPFITSSQSAVQIQPLLSSSQPAIQIQPLVSTSQSGLQIQPLVSTSQSALQIQPLVSSSQSSLQIQPLVTSQSALQIQPMVSSSQSGLQIQPLVSGTPAAVQPVATTTTKSSSGTSHIALIPVDNLTAVGQNFPSRSKTVPPPIRMMAPSPLPVKTASSSMDNILEKDGLVMINSNLALRIVSSLPTLESGTSTTTSATTIQPICTQLTTNNNLTILPQVEGSKFSNSKKEGLKNPDILTIVPQIDVNKKVSLLKNAPSTANTQTSIPKGSAASQVVKLYLLHPKDAKGKNGGDSIAKLGIPPEPTIGMNGLEVPLPLLNGIESTATSENGNSREQGTDEDEEIDDFDEEDEEGMVIDDERDGDEDLMDPLSLCAVTMEDENLDASNSSSQAEHFSADSAASSEDRVTIRKIVGKPTKGKSNQGVDIVKYEARKYVCCYCNRRFGWSTDLKRHVILHTGEKPFQCKVCPTAFTRKFLLQNHMKRMHPDKCKMSDLWP